jgi:hypothetical protein
MRTTIRRTLPTALAGALLAGALAVPVIAQETGTGDNGTVTEVPATPDVTDADETEGHHSRGHHGLRSDHGPALGLDDETVAAVAAELGIPTEELTAAVRTVLADRLEERLATRVAEGRLTQDQADRLVAAAGAGTLEEVGPEVRLEVFAADIADRVASGDLTEAEADELLAAAEAGEFPRDGRRERRGDRRENVLDRVRDRVGGALDALDIDV